MGRGGGGSRNGGELGSGTGRGRALTHDDVMHHLQAARPKDGSLTAIHEVRDRVARAHGKAAASHEHLDTMLKTMRAEGKIRLVSINVLADATPKQLDRSIPGMNETLFFID